uniref:Uncharacterized protein n=1 Tax=Arundo donax TaxID=35708 RepID=A0A0A9DU10_ARUDO
MLSCGEGLNSKPCCYPLCSLVGSWHSTLMKRSVISYGSTRERQAGIKFILLPRLTFGRFNLLSSE